MTESYLRQILQQKHVKQVKRNKKFFKFHADKEFCLLTLVILMKTDCIALFAVKLAVPDRTQAAQL